MKLDVQRAGQVACEIGRHQEILDEINSKLSNAMGNLEQGWSAKETSYMAQAMNILQSNMRGIAAGLSSIETEIISAANRIRQEEDAQEAAEIAARKAEMMQPPGRLPVK